jgi:tRNA A-37 threonylcarbamoyl transferase component Bud32
MALGIVAKGDWEIVKSAAPRTVLRGAGRVAKVYRDTGRLDRLRRRLLGRSPARREVACLRRAREIGLPVPRVLEPDPTLAGQGEEVVVLEEIPDATPLDAAVLEGALVGAARRRTARALGTLIRKAHDAGLRHPDLHAGNVLLSARGKLWLIDLHRARFVRLLGPLARRRSLLALGRFFLLHATRAERMRFLKAYDPVRWRARAGRLEVALRRSCEAFWRRRLARRYVRSRHVFDLRRDAWRGVALTAFPEAADLPLTPVATERALKSGGRTSTVSALRLGERDVVLKRYHRKKARSPWLDAFRGSRARRAFRLGHALRMRGLDTPEPLAYLERRAFPGRRLESLLVTEHLAGVGGHAALDADRRSRLLGLGGAIRRLWESGFRHRDLKLANWLWPDGSGRPALLDLDGLRHRRIGDRGRGLHLARLDRDLDAAGVSRTDRLRVVLAALGPASRERRRTVLAALAERRERTR